MTARIPKNYSSIGDSAIASFDYTDLISGQGIKKFYAGATEDTTAAKYILTAVPFDGTIDYRIFSDTTDTACDLDFDTSPLVYPLVIAAGTAIVEFTVNLSASTGYSGSMTLYKVSGGVETQIGTVTLDAYTAGGGGAEGRRESAHITLTRTTLAVDDQIRLNLQYGRAAGAGAAEIYFDPNSIATVTEGSNTVGTDLVISIPFEVDI